MKKLLAMLLAVSMVFALCACGATPAAAPAAETVKIGMVTDVGGINDKSFNQTAWEGLQAMAAEDASFEVNYLESKTDADYQTNIGTFLDEGYDLIICVGYMLADATREAATANPDQYFAIIDDASIDLPNVACLTFAQEQASYLVGMVAGLVTESNTVGYVQGMVSDTMNLFGIGYVSGVLAVNPDAKVLQYNANNFADVALGSTAATDMITNGADVIYQAAGGTGIGVISTCDEKGVWAIGVDTDQAPMAPDHVITSAMKRVDNAVVEMSKNVKDGTFTGGEHHFDLNNGGVDLAPTRDHIPADVLEKVEAAKADIMSGKIVVPTTVDACPQFTLK